MNGDQDIERVLERWLGEGPSRMPARFLDDTIDRIDHLPTRPFAALRSRLPVLEPDRRLALAAALIVAMAGLGALVLTRAGGVGGDRPAGPGAVPTALQAEWRPVGTRQLPGRSGPIVADLDIVIDPTAITIFDFHVDVLNSASVVGPDRLELRAMNKGFYWHCQVGDTGVYTFSLSAVDQHLTLTPVNDACAERATILRGDWTRTDIGGLAPGRHVSAFFRPLVGGTSGQLSYTVPNGWTEIAENPTGFSFAIPNRPDGGWFNLVSDFQPYGHDSAGDKACTGVAGGNTPAKIAAWLATLTGLVVTTPTPVTIGGLSGVMVDLTATPGTTNPCSVAVANKARYIVLDSGEGRTLLIDIQAPDQASWDAVIAETMPVVESFEFTR